jgi:hypothetical protein
MYRLRLLTAGDGPPKRRSSSSFVRVSSWRLAVRENDVGRERDDGAVDAPRGGANASVVKLVQATSDSIALTANRDGIMVMIISRIVMGRWALDVKHRSEEV